ncbi:recombination protein RecR [Litorivicinus lipolyticus]|uniref:Recombination protein RecR n=1 Tax=Litorivicinus lipolyticus TaxID=418701 RepID=A0A5Q2Q7N2_9GAMM|nr:recombination mediator RecR [Litorivicinus lipolyticus]QGG80018.1 recombination protein RecR [Litorivicinus lipolyticus]
MKSFSPLFDELQRSLQVLPGVGPRSAQRMALNLIERTPSEASKLATVLAQALRDISHCHTCYVLSESETCQICADPKRDAHRLMVVESPGQLMAFERAGLHDGHYFVLNGLISPLDGISPDQVRIPQLLKRVGDGVTEVVLALTSSVEGEATAHYIKAQCPGVTLTRLARGIPMGGDIESLDPNTLELALGARESWS